MSRTAISSFGEKKIFHELGEKKIFHELDVHHV